MSSPNTSVDNQRSGSIVDAAIRIAFIALIAAWCFLIFKPFVTVIVWSMIIAVTAYPFFKTMTRWFGGRQKAAAAVFAIIVLSIVIVPGVLLVGSVSGTGKAVTEALEEGALKVPAPNIQVKDWPVVGEQAYQVWSDASANLERTLDKYHDEVRHVLSWLFKSLATIGIDIVLTLVALLIAIPMMLYAEPAYKAAVAFFDRMIGKNGHEFTVSSRDTIRSVVKGVVLVAVIQAILAWIGFWFADVPAAGVWAIIVLMLAIMQLPPLIIMVPLIIYVFSYASSGIAIAFTVWGILVSGSDTFLKPMFLGRGLKIPMLVILIGAIGGMILHGIVGLFIGAVVMALGYQLYNSWLNNWELTDETEPEGV